MSTDTNALVAAIDAAHDRITALTMELVGIKVRLKEARVDLRQAERALRERHARKPESPGLFDWSAAPQANGETPAVPPSSLPLGTAATQDRVIPPQRSRSDRRAWRAYDRRTGTDLGEVLASTREAALTLALDRRGDVPASEVAVRDTTEHPPAGGVWDVLAAECPQKIAAHLHQAGHYLHGVYRGSTVCTHKDDRLLPDWAPTPAQAAAWASMRHKWPDVESAPVEPSWDRDCDFLVTLADGQQVGCTWEPDRTVGAERGALTFAGAAISPSGHLQTVVGEVLRAAPLPEVAKQLAQQAADRHAAGLAKPPEKVKEPKRRKKVVKEGEPCA